MEYNYDENNKEELLSDKLHGNQKGKLRVKSELNHLESHKSDSEDEELVEKMKEEEARLKAQFIFGWYY